MIAKDLKEHLSGKLIGQEHVIDAVAMPINRYNNSFHWEPSPAGVYLLMGPSGVGKTETVHLVAEYLHQSRDFVLKFDCAEYQHSHEIAKLVGSPPGYLGHKETEAMLSKKSLLAKRSPNHPLTVILFDEIEKAHPSLFQLLLGVLDKGTFHTGTNEQVYFKDTLIFFTSNLGTQQLAKPQYSFLKSARTDAERTQVTEGAAKQHFTTEFLNRVDVVLTYNHLTQSEVARIVEHLETEANDNLRRKVDGRGLMQISMSPDAVELIAEKGYSPIYGARELKRVWEREILTPLSEFVSACKGSTRNWPVLRVETAGGKFDFTPMSMEEALRASVAAMERDRVEREKTEREIFGAKVKGSGK